MWRESLGTRRLVAFGVTPPAGLARSVRAEVRVVDLPPPAPIDLAPALSVDAAVESLRAGIALADDAVDSGVGVLLAAGGATAGAAAVVASATEAEPVTAVARTSDAEWSRRVVAVRDALRRSGRPRAALPLVAELGGYPVGAMAGLVVGAAVRRTPVVVDGPLADAAALVVAAWAPAALSYVVPAHRSPVPVLADLGLRPLLDLGLEAGDGTAALLVLSLLDAAAETGHLP